jgi:thiol-disulfide isomerase/thioredoxin
MNTLFVLSFCLLTASCSSLPYKIEIEDSGTEIVTGEFNRTVLTSDDHLASWFSSRYNEYQVDTTLILQIEQLSKGVRFVIIAGTWCSDSKREIPHLFKILDAAQVSDDQVWMFGVDRTKKSRDDTTQRYRIVNVPTIIMMKDGREIGRIIEHPEDTLEKDLVKILSFH